MKPLDSCTLDSFAGNASTLVVDRHTGASAISLWYVHFRKLTRDFLRRQAVQASGTLRRFIEDAELPLGADGVPAFESRALSAASQDILVNTNPTQ